MVESKTSSLQPTSEQYRGEAVSPERMDHPHVQLGHPHIKLHRAPTGSGGSPPVAAPSGSPPPDDRLPPKLRQRMERLMADLAALEEPSSPVPTPTARTTSSFTASPEPRSVPEPAPAEPELEPELYVPSPEELVEDPAVSPATWADERDDPASATAATADGANQVARPLSLPLGQPVEPLDSPQTESVPTSTNWASAAATATFSQQAREVLEILKRRQEQLSQHKSELERREAAIEKQLRQERLALVEKQRLIEAQSGPFPTDLTDVDPGHAPDAIPPQRKITLEWIAQHERGAGQAPPSRETSGQVADQAAKLGSSDPTSVDSGSVSATTTRTDEPALIEPAPGSHEPNLILNSTPEPTGPSSASPRLKEQADLLRRQHETAIRAMQQTRRQLELLKDIVLQQQQQWSTKVDELDREHHDWARTREALVQQWQNGLEELERLRSIELSDTSKRETFLEQREAAVRAMEERLQQTQVEILRDRVVLKQLERSIRQTMSNADWNERWQIISEETQAYLKKVQQDSEMLRTQAKRQVEKLESRRSEMLMYRESLRRWIERQMKLISRRAAHVEERESELQKQGHDLRSERQRLTNQQATLNETLGSGLQVVDRQLQTHRNQRRA